MKAVIMAGGKGTRLQSIAKDVPKPMFPVNGKPILQYQIESLRQSGITDVIIMLGHLGECIKEYFKNGKQFGVNICYIQEESPLGTAGSLYYLKGVIKQDFFLVFGDLMLDVDWNRFASFHKEKGASISLYAHPNSHPYDSDVLMVDGDDRVLSIAPKSVPRDFYYHNLVNAGVYCVNERFLDLIKQPVKTDLEKGLIFERINSGDVFAYRSTEYVKDMGTPDRLNSVQNDLTKGVVNARNLSNKQRAIFLDRDGTINVSKGFLNSADKLELIDGVSNAIKKINTSRYLAIVITNQPVIARGECSFEELNRIHKKMETLLGEEGAYIDDLYFCPHHPDKGFEGEVVSLKIDCNCRKPKIGMIEKAVKKYNIDLAESWYVGDTTVDVMTGINAGVRTVLVKTGEAGKDGKYNVTPTATAKTLEDAIDFILNFNDKEN